MAHPELAIILTSYQLPGHLRRALESIACQRTRHSFEVIVADDGSRDETPTMVAEFAAIAPFSVRFVTHEHDGFHPARCRNEGVRASTAQVLLFCDGDCLLPPDHVETHLKLARPGFVNCGSCVRLSEQLSQEITLEKIQGGEFVGLAPSKELAKLRRIHQRFWWYRLIGHRTKPALKSTDFSLHRSDFERVNGFDEKFRGWGCEDDDLGLRLRAAGMKLVSVLDRTHLVHLWHPPAISKPATWRNGANVAYFQRPIQLTRCEQGLTTRAPRDLTVRLAGEPQDPSAARKWIHQQGWHIECDAHARADLELLVSPGSGGFRGQGDCRVLVALDAARPLPAAARKAQVVLSPGGDLGSSSQVRLPLADGAGLWRALTARPISNPKAVSIKAPRASLTTTKSSATTPITALIAAAGQPQLLKRTLDSLAQCARPAQFTGTLVVENGPPCGIEAICRARPRAEQVRYLYVPDGNKSHALNVALTQVDGLIFFTDDDVRFDPQILQAYARGSWGVASGEIYSGPLHADYEAEPPPAWMRAYLPKSAIGWKMEATEKTRIKRTMLGPNWAAFASDLRAIGGFEPRVGPGAPTRSTGQETEAQRRLYRRGVKGYYIPDAIAWHFVRAKCLTHEWIVDRGFRHGLEWGLRYGRDPKFGRVHEAYAWLRYQRRRWMSSLMRAVGGERWKLAADYSESRWRGRWEGIALGRRWDDIPVPQLPAELRRAA
ncbi:MAG: glycosyltransferase [Pirellulaceae bacterium]|nr:glycosyltransferase [Pirellulaceae bacterium]